MATSTGVVPPLKTFIKDPDSKLDYTIDWAKWLGADTVSTSTWFIDPAGDVAATAPSIDTAQKRTTVWLDGGTDGATFRVTNRIATAGGRIVDRSFLLTIAER